MREIDAGIITYHKHWYVLLAKTYLPLLIMILVLGVIYWLTSRYSINPDAYPAPSSILTYAIPILLMCVVWLIYQYVDWHNDIYQLTKDSIVDSERKPLGTEITKSAPLKNILSLDHKKEGILGILLNFGTVNINVGDSTLSFYDVHNPTLVQKDIFQGIERFKKAQKTMADGQERQRMVEWIKSYHQLSKPENERDSE